MTIRFGPVLAGAAVALVLAACGLPGGRSSAGGASTPTDCPSVEVVNALLGTHLGGDVKRSKDLRPDSYACSYANAEGPLLPATIQVDPHADERSITAWSYFAKHPLTKILDLGDEAGSWSEAMGDRTVNGVIARRGELLVMVVAFAPVDRVKALTAKVFELIG